MGWMATQRITGQPGRKGRCEWPYIRGSLGSQGRRRWWGVDGHIEGHCAVRKDGGTVFFYPQQKTW